MTRKAIKKKKINLLLSFLIFFIYPLNAISQQHSFILKIHFDDPSVKTLGIGEAYWRTLKPYHAAKIRSDSANIKDNTFLFEGTTLYPTAIRIWPMDNTKYFNKLIFIDTGYQEITLIKTDSSYAIKANTAIEKEHRKFLNETGIKTIDDKIDGDKLLSYVQKNPNSYVALFAIINQAFNYPYKPFFNKINQAFGKKINQTKAFQYYKSIYNPAGAEDPDFLGTSLDGKKITLSSFNGKNYLLLDFWASWCKPCREMIPHLKELYQKYHAKGLEIIGISSDENENLWKKVVREENIQSWINLDSPVYSLNKTNGPALGIKYSIQVIPTTILIDKNGSIIARYEAGSEDDSTPGLDKKLSEIFGTGQ